jgi:murein DD-endopeptidase MepM/ murein hydrolase activator NlpD
VNYNNFINKDFRNRSQTEIKQRHPALRWGLLGAGFAVIGAVIASTGGDKEDAISISESGFIQTIEADASNTQTSSSSIQLKLPTPSQYKTIEKITAPVTEIEHSSIISIDTDNPIWNDLKVKSGDSLSVLFDRAKIKPAQLLELMKLGKATSELKRIHPGDIIKIISDEEGNLLSLNYQIDGIHYLQVERDDNQLTANILKHHIEVRTAYASGEIESSLFLASAGAGLSQNTTMELANVFGWDIDFALDIRKGDKFTVIYEQRFKNGVKIKDGNILAAEFINQGKTFRALRYTDPVTNYTGYYSPDGHSLRKAFLRSPVKFSRISSRFTTKRYHPILHRFRSHKGVDYASGRGTPIRASGDGKVIYKGNKGGYGRTIIIKHGSRYTTLYAHMNSYNRKIRSGKRVKQGQVIGYVGSSGLASGPHLHYEFRVNGVHRNPLTVKFPSTKPIPKRYRDNFELTTKGYVAQLDVLSRSTLALNGN